MIKNECEIVRDLLPNYIENQIADGTKEFVEKHIKSCKECKEILNSAKRWTRRSNNCRRGKRN